MEEIGRLADRESYRGCGDQAKKSHRSSACPFFMGSAAERSSRSILASGTLRPSKARYLVSREPVWHCPPTYSPEELRARARSSGKPGLALQRVPQPPKRSVRSLG